MSTVTLHRYQVETYGSKTDRRSITVAAQDEAAAKAAAVAGHKAQAGLPNSASVLAMSARVITTPVTAPKPMTKAQQSHIARTKRALTAGARTA